MTGSTVLGESTDPEALRALLARYFERMKGIVEAHGGTVEKFIGDAVMAVFGVPTLHEDDAQRACRAAVEMRDAFAELGISGRIGVTSGEVVTGTAERLATGDAVNVAARLEQAAAPGEVLIGAETLALARGAVSTEPIEPLTLKGKSKPVPAFRLISAHAELARSFATPMIGRETELRRLRDAFAQAVHDRSCQLFTVLGSAGVGKSRLAAELLAAIEARVVRGNCLSYGEGITYWPVVEIIKQLDALPEGDAAVPIRSLLGESDAATSAEEIAWGFRKLIEEQAHEQPIVCVFDDLHWAEETLLDLVEHVADLARDAPVLLLCMAVPNSSRCGPPGAEASGTPPPCCSSRPTPQRPSDSWRSWAAPSPCCVSASPRPPREIRSSSRRCSHSSAPPGIAKSACPRTIHALLAARLDQLEPAERAVLERGSVEGHVFHESAVQALADGEPQTPRLVALVRKQLIRPDTPQFAGEEAYRFRHLLIRDAAYDVLPKAVRADLHERFADWLEQRGADLVELDEILGYHLEQAYRCLVELGRAGDRGQRLAEQAAERLSAAGRRAYARADTPAAINLLERASALLPPHDRRRLSLLPSLGRALMESGELERSDSVLSEAVENALGAGDQLAEATKA